MADDPNNPAPTPMPALEIARYARAVNPHVSAGQIEFLLANAPAADPGKAREFISATLTAFQPSAPAAPTVQRPLAASDTGAAIATQTGAVPQGHPFRWPAHLIASMDPVTFRQAARDYEAKNGGTENVTQWQAARREMGRAERNRK